MPYYRRKLPNGKIQKLKRIEIPITDEEFIHKVSHGKFEHPSHKAYCVLLYYSAVRKWEALRVTRENFEITDKDIMFDVGQRLKKLRRSKLCPNCKTKNGGHSLFCRKCGADISNVSIVILKAADAETPTLNIPLDAAHVHVLKKQIEATPYGQKVFPFSDRTAYNIMRRAGFHYPHLARLSRITQFFSDGWTVDQVHSWTGLTLAALNQYIGIVDVYRMGQSMTQRIAPLETATPS